jgi:hypothetical protein
MSRSLKVFNGDSVGSPYDGHLYVCAQTIAEAVQMIKDVGYSSITRYYFDLYWHKGVWGTIMEKNVPVRMKGVWFVPRTHAHESDFVPERIL